jgi:hypothetical protein
MESFLFRFISGTFLSAAFFSSVLSCCRARIPSQGDQIGWKKTAKKVAQHIFYQT